MSFSTGDDEVDMLDAEMAEDADADELDDNDDDVIGALAGMEDDPALVMQGADGEEEE